MLYSLIKCCERAVLWATPLRRLIVPRFQYSFSPGQLARMYELFRDSHRVEGISVEIGCFVGATTVFLNSAYRYQELKPRPYWAVDTFSGFTSGDLAYERTQRGKRLDDIDDTYLFGMNSKQRFDYTMAVNRIGNVTSFQADIAAFDFGEPARRIAFALVDVDLYLPTKAALGKLAPRLSPGGVLVVDDCIAGSDFDGSLQALQEAASERGWSFAIEEGKLGVVRIPA